MIYLLGTLYIIVCGYIILRLTKFTENNLLYNLGLSWILGLYLFSFISLIWYGGFHLPINLVLLFLWLILLIILFIYFFNIKEELNYLKQTYHTTKQNYLPNNYKYIYILSLIIIFITLSFTILHGKNTPTNTDDAARLRAFTPYLVYQDLSVPEAHNYIIDNSLIPTFGTFIYWDLEGEFDQFYINYLVITTVIAFLLILFFYPHQPSTQRFLSLILIYSIPLFLYHSTATYVDLYYGIPYTLGLFYLLQLTKSPKYLALAFLMFTFTAFGKNEGNFMFINGAFIILLYLIYHYYREDRSLFQKSYWKYYSIIFIPLIYFIIQEIHLTTIQSIYNMAGNMIAGNMADIALEQTKKSIPSDQVWYVIRYSWFSSHNFGLIFWIGIVTIISYFKKLWSKEYLWGTLLLFITFSEVLYAFTSTPAYVTVLDQTTIHRASIMLALISSIYISNLIHSHD